MMHTTLSIRIARFRTWLTPRTLWRRPFIRNAAVVIGGTATAQAITVAFSPIITRLYSPDAFGILGVFTSLISILTPIAALCYPHAIVLPPEDEDGLRLVRLAVLIAAGMTVLMAAVIIPFQSRIASLLGLESVAPYLLLVPLVVLLATAGRACDQWLIRKKLFRVSSGIAIAQALAVNGGKTVLGFVVPSAATLIGVTCVGHGLHAGLSVRGSLAARRTVSSVAMSKILGPRARALIYQYRDFPQYRMPQTLLNSLSKNLPTVMLAALFDPAVAGLYAIGQRVLKMPTIVISDAIGRVFQQHIAQATHKGQSLRPLIIKVTVGLAAIGILPFGSVMMFGPSIFSFVFGVDWFMAGEYARWLSLWLFFGFVNVPSVAAVPLLSLQSHLLVLEIVTVLARLAAILVGALLLDNATFAIAGFSIVGSASYLVLIAYVVHESSRRSRFAPISQ